MLPSTAKAPTQQLWTLKYKDLDINRNNVLKGIGNKEIQAETGTNPEACCSDDGDIPETDW